MYHGCPCCSGACDKINDDQLVKKRLRRGLIARARRRSQTSSDQIFISPRGPEDDLHNRSGKAYGRDFVFHLQARNYDRTRYLPSTGCHVMLEIKTARSRCHVRKSANAVWHAASLAIIGLSLLSSCQSQLGLWAPISCHGRNEDFETPTVPNLRFSPAGNDFPHLEGGHQARAWRS